MRHILPFAVALTAIGALAAGCGSNDPGETSPSDAEPAPSDDAHAAHDGMAHMDASSTADADATCPSSPLAGTPATGPSDTIPGLAPIPSEFDFNLGLMKAGGTGAIPPSGAPDVVGAFRFICGAGQLLYDDPIVFPCRPGASHLHQFYGNLGANAFSTFESLRTTGKSTCANGDNPVNRSAYWTPAMLDGKGKVVQPDWEAVYYKRRPLSDPKCSRKSGDPKAMGDCVPVPAGIQYIFGWDPTKSTTVRTGGGYFNCDGPGAKADHYPDIPTAAPNCPVGTQLLAVLDAPSCWDGKSLDSPDHRSHMSYAQYGSWGYLKCDDAHPFVLPEFHLAIAYSVAAGDDLTKWTLSSDVMAPDKPHGYTLHGDYKEAWDDTVKTMWTEGCVNGLLNCSGGDLGNGKQVIGAGQPAYGWKNPNHLVPIP